MQINYKRANTTPSVHEMTRQEESTRPKYYRTFISIYGFEQAGKILITLVSSKLFMYSHLRAGFGFSPSRRPRRRQPSPSLISLIIDIIDKYQRSAWRASPWVHGEKPNFFPHLHVHDLLHNCFNNHCLR